MQNADNILICSNHQSYPTPLIWTFAFNGSEYWCPFCGTTGGMFGAGKNVEITDELVSRNNLYTKASKEFLDAVSTSVCSSLLWNGNRISPKDLPEEERDRLQKIIDGGFKYKGIKIESTEASEVEDNLTKENFWNELYAKYPLGMKMFCDWIDAYKKKNNWDNLFKNHYAGNHAMNGIEYKTIKYHDLPLAMQIGIWIEFVGDRGGCDYEVDLFSHDWKQDISEYIKMLQAEKEI